MAAARPLAPSALPDDTPAAEAEVVWRLVVDAQRDDLALLRRRWPDRTSPESLGAIERLRRRSAPGGDAEQAMAGVHAAYGGPGRVPQAVRARLEGYVLDNLGARVTPTKRWGPGEATRVGA